MITADQVVDRRRQPNPSRIRFNRARFSAALRAFRGDLSLNAAELVSGISARTLERLERGRHSPTQDVFAEVCAWMNKTPNHFFDFDTKPLKSSDAATESRLSTTTHKLERLQAAVAQALRESRKRED